MHRFRSTSLACLLALGVSAAFAQTGAIQGALTDAAGASVPNAKVTAFDQDKGVVAREGTSSNGGDFHLTPLLPGHYTVRVEARGFKAFESKNLTLDQNQIMNLGVLSLQLGQVTDSITVEAQVPLVETSTAQKSFVISSKEVTEIPLNGRDFQTLLRTLPGVVSNDTSDFRLAFNNTNSFNVNGQRGSSNNVFLDGAINTDVGANDGQYTQISLDAVGEFKLQTSAFNAEYGRNPGVMISINTKSGGSSFHGTAYEFLRNDALDARRPFDTTGSVAKLRYNQFGGNLSGPILIPHFSTGADKKLFFFFNYEGTRATRPLNSNTFVDVPSPQILSGDFRQLYRLNANGTPQTITGSNGVPVGTVFQPGTIVRDSSGRAIGGTPYPNNTVPMSQWNRNAPAFIKLMSEVPLAGAAPTPGSPEQVRVPFTPGYVFNKNAKVARVDYNISPTMNFFFRWADDAQQEQQDIGIFASLPYPVYPQFREKPGASWSWNLVNVISPRTTNEFIFAYNHLTQVVDVVPGTDKSKYDRTALGFQFQELFPDQNVRNRFPSFNCGIGSCNYSPFQANWRSEGKTYAFTDNLTLVRGTHNFKTGIYFNWNDNGQQPGWSDALNTNFGPNASNPNDTGNQFANMLLGDYTSVSQTKGIFYGAFRFFVTEAYVQDSWKMNRKLTLEYGVRWGYEGPTYTRGKYLQYYFEPNLYDPSKAVAINTASGVTNGTIIAGSGNPYNGLIQEGSPGLPLGGVQHRHNNWAPRLGFAYDPFGDGKTAIRAGGGIFYERVQQNVYNFGGLGNPPLVSTPTLYGGNLDGLSPALASSGTIAPVTITAVDMKGQIPTTYAWSFDIQRELGAKTSLDVGYVGNLGRHLQYNRNLGQLPLNTTTAPGTKILSNVNFTSNAIRPYRGFGDVNFTEFGATSNYNALQTRISRRFAAHLTLNASYVWSKAMDEVDADGNVIGYYLDRRRDYARAGYDRTHVFSFDYVYELPAFAKQNAFLKTVVNGWQLAGNTRFWSGPPINVTANGDPGTLTTSAPNSGQRADYLGGQIYPDNQSRLTFFNPLVFARPANGSLGNLGRNALTGPGINQWDISMYKNTHITERVTAQLRVETFNTFNHTQWATVNGPISVPNPSTAVTAATVGSAGQVTNTRDPRNIQLAFKILF
jgi:hypothetical protein